MPRMNAQIVRGEIVGGRGPLFLIAVDDTFGRVYWLRERRLSALTPIQSILAQNPEAFSMPFDGTREQAEAILDAAHEPQEIDAQPVARYDLPDYDVIWRDPS